MSEPLSRNEAILQATIDGTEYNEPPQSRIEELLIELKEVIEQGGGGGGGTSNYNLLENKPSINNVELSGNKTTADLDISYNDLDDKPTIPEPYVLPTASNNTLGGIKSGDRVTVDDGVLSANEAQTEQAVTTNTQIGALPSGTVIQQGTTLTELVKKIAVAEIAPTVAFSLSKGGNVAYGESYTETLTVNVSNMGTAKKIKTIAWYEGNTLLDTDTIDSTTTGSWTYTMSTATTDTMTFKAIVTYTKSDDEDATIEKTAQIKFYYNKFYGMVDSLTPSEATVEALTSALGTAKGGTYSFSGTAQRIAYAYPKSLGALSSIKDGNGFSLFDSFTRTEESYTENGTTVAYYLYVLTDPTTISGYSVIFA